MRISDWSSDVCSSDLLGDDADDQAGDDRNDDTHDSPNRSVLQERDPGTVVPPVPCRSDGIASCAPRRPCQYRRSEEHTSELQSLMRISYAVFCLKKKNHDKNIHYRTYVYEIHCDRDYNHDAQDTVSIKIKYSNEVSIY